MSQATTALAKLCMCVCVLVCACVSVCVCACVRRNRAVFDAPEGGTLQKLSRDWCEPSNATLQFGWIILSFITAGSSVLFKVSSVLILCFYAWQNEKKKELSFHKRSEVESRAKWDILALHPSNIFFLSFLRVFNSCSPLFQRKG